MSFLECNLVNLDFNGLLISNLLVLLIKAVLVPNFVCSYGLWFRYYNVVQNKIWDLS